jgi:hypothetical protein
MVWIRIARYRSNILIYGVENMSPANKHSNNDNGYIEDFILAIALLCFVGFVIGFVFEVHL